MLAADLKSGFRRGLDYERNFLDEVQANELLVHCLDHLPWAEELVQMFGRTFVVPRLSCAIGDEGCVYRYRGSQMDATRFTRPLEELRAQIVERLRIPFNYVLATQYRDGNDYVGWHADDERDLVPGQTIVNISLGGVREFRIRSRDGSYCESVQTEHGSMLLMHGEIHQTTKHMLVRTRRSVEKRVVLSFREVRR